MEVGGEAWRPATTWTAKVLASEEGLELGLGLGLGLGSGGFRVGLGLGLGLGIGLGWRRVPCRPTRWAHLRERG